LRQLVWRGLIVWLVFDIDAPAVQRCFDTTNVFARCTNLIRYNAGSRILAAMQRRLLYQVGQIGPINR
jgi:hypothetical protein